MSFKSFESILEFAIDKESEAIRFYTEASHQEKYMAGQKTFLRFADEEKKHKAMLENLDRKAIAQFEPARIADLKRSDYMVGIEYSPGMSYPDILLLAMKREEKAKNFYEDSLVKMPQGEYRRLFHLLAQEEAKHKLALETLFDDLRAKGGD